MPNITQPQVLAAISSIISGVSDTGIVLTRERFVRDESGFLKLFVNLNSATRKPHGWLIGYVGFEQSPGDVSCEITRTLKYAIESLYPYEDKRADGSSSHEKFRAAVEAVNDALNLEANRDLGLGNLVEHKLLQTEEDFVVRAWGEGADAVLTHYGVFNLRLDLTVKRG